MSKTKSTFAALAIAAVAAAGFSAPLGAKNFVALNVQYVTGGMVPGTSVAQALCPAGYIVTGGGGITTSGTPAALQQSFPISDVSGTVAYGSSAIGWQVAADDWSDVQAFVVCLAS
jgi:hypothetical protein